MAISGVNVAALGNMGLPGSDSARDRVNGGFKDLLARTLQEANQNLVGADRLGEQLVTGQVQDVSQVMIAAQKAELSLQLAIQIRNKLLEAYQEIMRMQV